MKRQTIGSNYLDDIIPMQEGEAQVSEQIVQKPLKVEKRRITVQISEDVIERMKNAVYWTPGLTLACLAEEAFSKAVDSLEGAREAPFPKRKEELKTGRPIH